MASSGDEEYEQDDGSQDADNSGIAPVSAIEAERHSYWVRVSYRARKLMPYVRHRKVRDWSGRWRADRRPQVAQRRSRRISASAE